VSSPDALSRDLIHTVARWHRRHLPRSRPATQKPANDKTILVADDNRMNLQVTSRMLKLDGYTVLEAEAGEEALDLLLTRKVDLAFLDVNMPDQDGIEVCMTYRSVTAKDSSAVIVGLTADISEETRSKCLAAGMTNVLTKPLDLEDLRAFLARVDDDGAPKHSRSAARTVHQADVPVLDIERLELLVKLFSLDTLKSDLLSKFETEVIAHAGRLRVGTAALPPKEMHATLHAIKSSALTIGAPRLARLMSASRDGQHDGISPASFENVINELNVFLHSCRAFFDQECDRATPAFKDAASGRRE
jgi:two-component system sensor histidine kinase RpfC